MVTNYESSIMKITTIHEEEEMMKGLIVTGLTVAFGFVAYEKLTYVVDVVKHLVA